MEKITEKRFIEKIVTIYKALDGQEFDKEQDCLDYESRIKRKEAIEKAEELKIEDLYDCLPIDVDGLVNDNNIFNWYLVKNKEEAEILSEAYSKEIRVINEFPQFVCVETCGYEIYMDDAYSWEELIMKENTINFWKKLGYDLEFKRISDN